ncbi:hypothetical protein JZ751_016537 [Albula glossodonta]|uniref:PDZ domain-containing protein n=1 Tax=Albula glossodonta TaxID=121402 RepID=A0A8T2NYN2_9TELE|nr:hypothetical protein JZ751_016537 [Albula glossodonta]
MSFSYISGKRNPSPSGCEKFDQSESSFSIKLRERNDAAHSGKHPPRNAITIAVLELAVTSGGRGALAGLCEGDEVVSLNGEPCADLTLPQSLDIMDASAESLQLLIKRCGVPQNHGLDSEGAYCGEVEPAEGALESTTLEIWPSCGSPTQEELYISESQDEAYYGETESDTDLPRGARSTLETSFRGRPLGNPRPGAVVELQLSLADHSLEEASPGVGGGALMVAVSPRRDSSQDLDSGGSKTELTESLYITQADRKLLSQRSDLVTSSSSSLGQVEVTLQRPGRGCVGKEEEEEAEGKEGGSSGCVDPREEGGITEAPPARVSFGISAEGAEPAEEWDSETERDLGRPNKHRARHARLRRSESQSEKQVKEAKSKCKRIALLLTAAPNPNNKGVLMFKKHRQRAKKYTLVSYGTGETEPEDEDEDEEYELGKEDQAVEFTLLATSESELDEELLVNAQRQGDIVTYDWDTGLLEVEKKLDSQREMDRLPETKGKGALMFAKRRQRIDEITAQHEEMRKKGIPVEGVPETETETVTVTESVSSSVSPGYTENKFRVVPPPVPVNTRSQVWSPTGELIASRDERISVPAIKTGILQDTRKRGTTKSALPSNAPNTQVAKKGDKKAGFESGAEEDYLSLVPISTTAPSGKPLDPTSGTTTAACEHLGTSSASSKTSATCEHPGTRSASGTSSATYEHLGPSSASGTSSATYEHLGPSSASGTTSATYEHLGPSSASGTSSATYEHLGPSSASGTTSATHEHLGPSSASGTTSATYEHLDPTIPASSREYHSPDPDPRSISSACEVMESAASRC